MKNIYKNIFSALLAISLILEAPLTSFADGAGSSAGQGNTNAGASTSSTGNGTWNLNTKVGFRFTICDGAGNPVSNILGNSQINSLDVINSGVDLSVGEIWTACATQQQPGVNTGDFEVLMMNEFLEGIGESGHNLRWTDNGYNVYGDEVREFILKGATRATEAGGDINTGITDYKEKIKVEFNLYYNKLDEWMQKSMKVKDDREALEIAESMSSLKATFESAVKSNVSPSTYGDDWQLAQYALITHWNEESIKIKNNLLNQFPDLFKNNSEGNVGNIDFNIDIGSILTDEIMKNLIDLMKGKQQKSLSKYNPFDLFMITSYAATTDNIHHSLDIQANLQDEDVVATEYSVLYKIINLSVGKDEKTYVFQLEGSKNKVSDTEGKLPTEIFVEKGYILLVEPTIQGCSQGWNTKTNSAGVSYHSQVYGTAHNWLVGFGNSASFKSSGAYSPSFGNHQKALTRALPNGLITISNWTYLNDNPILLQPSHDGQWKIPDATAHMNEGYGCHIYNALDLAGDMDLTTLIDTGNPPVSEEESSKDIIINRFFRRKNKDSSYTNEKYDTHTYNLDKERKVYINKTADKYSLVEYGSSETEYYKPEKLEDWKEVSKHNTGEERGSTSKTLEIKPDTVIKTINILYEYTPETKVVKVYKTGDKVDRVTEPEKVDGETYKVPEEADYEYRENKKSEDAPVIVRDWPDTKGEPGAETEISIDEETNTIYILYVRDAGKQIILYSNELTYTYDLRDLLESRELFKIYDMAEKSPGKEYSCDGHSCRKSDCSSNHKCSNGKHILTKSDFSLSVANDFDYNSNTTFIKDYAATDKGNATFAKKWFASISSNKVPSEADRVKPNGDFVLYRQKDKDLVTLYPDKNENLKAELEGLGITATAYTPSGTRIEKETAADKYFINHFETYFKYVTHDTSLAWKWPRTKCGSGNKGTWLASAVTTPEQANEYYSANQENVKTFYFLGEENKGLDTGVADARDSAFSSRFKYNQAYSNTSADLNFYPYVKMFYREKDANDKLQDVFITSENLSTMKVFNAIQVGVYKKNKINANLTSTQWSTHARSLSFFQANGISDKKSVLPGGAIQDIDTGEKGDTQIGVRIYQSCLPDKQVQAVQDGFKVSESEARESADNLIEEIKKTITGYGLVQIGAVGVKAEMEDLLKSGEELHESTRVSFVASNAGKTSADDKYYLRQDGEGSNRANFDCLDSRIEKQNLYTIYSDTDGNVWLTKDGEEIGRISLEEEASNLIGKSDEIKLLDANTKLITNYVAALDRNKGSKNKYDRYNKNKYNEAFDGVSVLVTDISFDVGYGGNSAKRTNVLDVVLTAQADSKSDLYNFNDENKVRSSVYVTTAKSTTAAVQKAGYLGTLKGVSGIGDLETGLMNIYSFVYTKNFYIPNATVNDLN